MLSRTSSSFREIQSCGVAMQMTTKIAAVDFVVSCGEFGFSAFHCCPLLLLLLPMLMPIALQRLRSCVVVAVAVEQNEKDDVADGLN